MEREVQYGTGFGLSASLSIFCLGSAFGLFFKYRHRNFMFIKRWESMSMTA